MGQEERASARVRFEHESAPQPVSENQHPGWIWDAASNQWVADPNYQPSE